MKKVSLVFVVLALAAGVTFAQTNNIGLVTQSDLSQKATIDQQGSLNKSVVNQSNEGNTVDIKQTNSKAPGYDTYSEANQTGKRNLATIVQISNGTLVGDTYEGTLKALVTQSGNDNVAKQLQGGHIQQGRSLAEIIQGGSNNDAFQNQVKYGNEAKINQSGNWNTAKQAQDIKLPEGEEGSYNTALIDQAGSGNLATQEQDGWANDAKAFQSGSNNTSIQAQSVAWKSIAYVSQSGDWNTAGQTQRGNLNKASIDQQSAGNNATQNQTALGLKREGANYDPFNEASITQSGDNYNVAVQTQEFTDAAAVEGKSVAVKNMASISQNGYGNNAEQTQTGNDNLSTVIQSGNYNVATITQSLLIP